MNWSDLKDYLVKGAPLLGALIGGPAGAKVGALVSSALGVENTPEAVMQELTMNPESLVKLREIEATRQVNLQGLLIQQLDAELKAAVQNAGDVNATMQAEAKAEKWPQYSWRPAIGFSVALNLLLSALTVVVAYGGAIFYGRPEGLQHLPGILAALAGLIAVASPILGIASWFRGKEKMAKLGGSE